MIRTLIQPNRHNSTKEDREDFWHQAIELQKQSGLSRRDFCAQQDLDRAAFSRWNHKLKNKKSQPINNLTWPRHQTQLPQAFIEIHPSLEKAKINPIKQTPSVLNADFQLSLRNGFILTLSNNFDSEALKRLLQVVEVI